MSTQFTIDRVVPRKDDNVDVHIRYNGGAEILAFPKSYPATTILAQIRIELRPRELAGETNAIGDRYKDLLGRHDV